MQRLLVLVLALVSVSCVSRYQRDFNHEVARQSVPPTAIEGPWVGEWRSGMNGHHGPLWCIVSREQEGAYEFRYRAGWGALQFGDYIHRPDTSPGKGGARVFDGKMDLPGGAGVHEVDGVITPESFRADYRSERGDHGTMVLKRPE